LHFGSTKPAHFLAHGFLEHFASFAHKIGRPKVLRGFNSLCLRISFATVVASFPIVLAMSALVEPFSISAWIISR
jgi:hypothetical protein